MAILFHPHPLITRAAVLRLTSWSNLFAQILLDKLLNNLQIGMGTFFHPPLNSIALAVLTVHYIWAFSLVPTTASPTHTHTHMDVLLSSYTSQSKASCKWNTSSLPPRAIWKRASYGH